MLSPSPLQSAVRRHSETSDIVVKEMLDSSVPQRVKDNLYKYELLSGCVFVGHINTDLDSVSGAIGAAELYGGIAARAQQDVNTEILWALERWGLELPPLVTDIPDLANMKVCLVDHNQFSQTPKGVQEDQIVGVIDHHATQAGTIQTSNPIYFDIRPWGSMSTILAHTFMRQRQIIPQPVAGMLMSAILSDTLNFRSPTATETDKIVVSALAKITEVEDIDKYAQAQFKAKSRMIDLFSSAELVRGDQKRFNFKTEALNGKSAWNGAFGWGTLECVDIKPVVARAEEIIKECAALKSEQGLEFFFFTAVNIIDQRSMLFVCGDLEVEIAERAFGGKVSNGLLDLGSRVSRKMQFVPDTMKCLNDPEWQPSRQARLHTKVQQEQKHAPLVVDPEKGLDGQLVRKDSILSPNRKVQHVPRHNTVALGALMFVVGGGLGFVLGRRNST
mmetsp:Transcript_861/g.1681  ORF Transcript_861/g.1681 Transcript_861/m.1681 type:complete len:446 (+) Transcript_861:1-1338(+)